MKQKEVLMFFYVAVIAFGLFFLYSAVELEITGQSVSHSGKMITARGSTGKIGTGNIQMTFPASGGALNGRFSGRYNIGKVPASYSGTLKGSFSGGEGGFVQGTLNGIAAIVKQGRSHSGPITGSFSGTVSLLQGTVNGNWRGQDGTSEAFSLKFTPVKNAVATSTITKTSSAGSRVASSSVPIPSSRSGLGTLGYCRCITGPRTSGIEITPYGGSGMQFKGFTTYSQCVSLCDGRHSWRQR